MTSEKFNEVVETFCASFSLSIIGTEVDAEEALTLMALMIAPASKHKL